MLIETDELETVIRRFEDQRFARDTECVIHYLCALYSSSQLERAAKFILNDPNGKNSESPAATVHGSGFVIGTKDRPLHVINESGSSGGGNWSRKFTTAVNVAIVAAILYSIFSMNESKLGGMTSKKRINLWTFLVKRFNISLYIALYIAFLSLYFDLTLRYSLI